jgi:hypothetical protein
VDVRWLGGWGRSVAKPPDDACPTFFLPSRINSDTIAGMGTQHRKHFNDAGHAHELTFSCYRGLAFLKRERTRRCLADAIQESRENWQFDLWAYVVMPEHVHLVVRPREAEYDIAAIRKAIKAPVGTAAIAWLETNAPNGCPASRENAEAEPNDYSGNRVAAMIATPSNRHTDDNDRLHSC